MAEIKISELSIGDWVRVDDFDKVLIKRVSAIDGTRNQIGIIKNNRSGIYWYYDDEFEPIPLTPEILEKNGWSKEYDDVWEYGVWRISQIDKCLFVLYNEKYDYDFCVYIDTVHQLQNALRLAGVGKEVEL